MSGSVDGRRFAPAGAYLLSLTVLLSICSGCVAVPQQTPAVGREAAPERIEDRLQTLAERYTIEERPVRDPAQIRSQIASLEARRLKLLERYTPTHPSVLQIDRQLRILQERLAAVETAPTATSPLAP